MHATSDKSLKSYTKSQIFSQSKSLGCLDLSASSSKWWTYCISSSPMASKSFLYYSVLFNIKNVEFHLVGISRHNIFLHNILTAQTKILSFSSLAGKYLTNLTTFHFANDSWTSFKLLVIICAQYQICRNSPLNIDILSQ